MHIGKFRHKIDVASEFRRIEKSDAFAAEMLALEGSYRQACYFIIQAMEKAIRAKIFTLVNPNIEYFRERNRTHSIESAVEFLIEIVSTDEVVRRQVSNQLNTYVLGNTRYNKLHNDLRYPAYFNKYDSYSMLDISMDDFSRLRKRYESLKGFLDELNRFSKA